MNLLHDIPAGSADEMNVIIEIPRGAKNKYELNKEFGIIELDRVMHTAQDYPFDYGFVPQTKYDDGDPLDVVVLTTYPLAPGVLLKARPVAIMEMVDSGEKDDKIIAVPVEDPRFDNVKSLSDINEHSLKEIRHFFETYKQIQGKAVEVPGFKDVGEAKKAFEKSIEMYKN